MNDSKSDNRINNNDRKTNDKNPESSDIKVNIDDLSFYFFNLY